MLVNKPISSSVLTRLVFCEEVFDSQPEEAYDPSPHLLECVALGVDQATGAE